VSRSGVVVWILLVRVGLLGAWHCVYVFSTSNGLLALVQSELQGVWRAHYVFLFGRWPCTLFTRQRIICMLWLLNIRSGRLLIISATHLRLAQLASTIDTHIVVSERYGFIRLHSILTCVDLCCVFHVVSLSLAWLADDFAGLAWSRPSAFTSRLIRIFLWLTQVSILFDILIIVSCHLGSGHDS